VRFKWRKGNKRQNRKKKRIKSFKDIGRIKMMSFTNVIWMINRKHMNEIRLYRIIIRNKLLKKRPRLKRNIFMNWNRLRK